MRAAVITGPDVGPVCGEFSEPEVLPGYQLLDLVAAGIHQVTRSTAAGRHYGSAHRYPAVPGLDAVARTADGRLVYTGWPRAPWGTMAERMATPLALDLPAGADPLAIAAGVNPGMAGWLALSARREEVGALGTVVVLGATGMAGGMAVQSAFALGADRVVAAGRDPGELERLAARGAVTVSLGSGDPAAGLAEAIGGVSPSVVLDFVWGPVAEAAFAALSRTGLEQDDADISYVQIGALGRRDAAVPAALLRSRHLKIVGSGAGSVSTERLMSELPRVMELIADGTLEAPHAVYPLQGVGEAWSHRGPARALVVPG